MKITLSHRSGFQCVEMSATKRRDLKKQKARVTYLQRLGYVVNEHGRRDGVERVLLIAPKRRYEWFHMDIDLMLAAEKRSDAPLWIILAVPTIITLVVGSYYPVAATVTIMAGTLLAVAIVRSAR